LKGFSPKDAPRLEFRKISPARYRIRIHGANKTFPVVFSEAFDPGWRAYVSKAHGATMPPPDLLGGYKVLEGNADDQATSVELADYLKKGFVSTLGDGRTKVFLHRKWRNGRQVPDHAEKYTVDFVSKNFQGSVQNDNLPDGFFWESWSLPTLRTQFLANGYANGWVVETERICKSVPGACSRNADGGYDLELLVEFGPQKIYSWSIFLSLFTLFACSGYLAYSAWCYRRNSSWSGPF